MRDSNLSTLKGMPAFEALKVLDLGFSCLTSLRGMLALPNLRQLFLDNNRLSELSDLPALPRLEVMSVSGNRLETLENLPPLPSLVILAVANNELTSLRGLTALENLEEIFLLGNPVSELTNQIRLQLLVVLKRLVAIDGAPVAADEAAAATEFDLRTVECLKEGMNLAFGVHTDAFLAQLNRELVESAVAGTDVTLDLDEFAILGSLVPGGVASAVCRIASSDNVVVEYFWYRVSADETVFLSDEGPEYMLSDDDTFSVLRVDVNVFVDDKYLTTLVAISDVIQDFPRLEALTLAGAAVVASTLVAIPKLADGFQDALKYDWFRCTPSADDPENLTYDRIADASSSSYTLTAADVGCKIAVHGCVVVGGLRTAPLFCLLDDFVVENTHSGKWSAAAPHDADPLGPTSPHVAQVPSPGGATPVRTVQERRAELRGRTGTAVASVESLPGIIPEPETVAMPAVMPPVAIPEQKPAAKREPRAKRGLWKSVKAEEEDTSDASSRKATPDPEPVSEVPKPVEQADTPSAAGSAAEPEAKATPPGKGKRKSAWRHVVASDSSS